MRKIINIFTPYGVEILMLSFVINVLETAYFGWTMQATCRAEEIWDVGCAFGYLFGWSNTQLYDTLHFIFSNRPQYNKAL